MNRHPINSDRVELLTIPQRAERHLLPDELLLKDIGLLIYPDKNDRISFYRDVLQACDEGKIKYTGDIGIDNWEVNYDCLEFTVKPDENLDYFEKSKRANDKIKEYLNQAQKDTYSVMLPPSCYLHRDEIKAYFQNINLWPITDCLLANWFVDKQQAEAASNAGMTKPTKNQQRDEDYKIWLEETNLDIDDMTKADIQAALIPRNRTLWTSGFNDWVKHTALYAGRRGRKLG